MEVFNFFGGLSKYGLIPEVRKEIYADELVFALAKELMLRKQAGRDR